MSARHGVFEPRREAHLYRLECEYLEMKKPSNCSVFRLRLTRVTSITRVRLPARSSKINTRQRSRDNGGTRLDQDARDPQRSYCAAPVPFDEEAQRRKSRYRLTRRLAMAVASSRDKVSLNSCLYIAMNLSTACSLNCITQA